VTELRTRFAGIGRVDASRPSWFRIVIAVPLGILAATAAEFARRSCLPRRCDAPAFRCRYSSPGSSWFTCFTISSGWAPAPLGRLDVFFTAPPQVTGFYLIDSLIARDPDTFMAALKQLILPALTLGIFSLAPIARMTRASMLAVLSSDFVRTARASGLSAYTVIITYGIPQCHAAGHHHARHGVLLPARRQCAGREGIRLAGHRLLRRRGAARLRTSRRCKASFSPWR